MLGRKDLGTGILRNLTPGGEGGREPGFTHTPETCAKLCYMVFLLRNINAIGEAQIGKHVSTRARMSASAKKKRLSPEHKVKIGLAEKGNLMKSYELYVFTQPGCPPCDRLKAHVSCLTPAQQAVLHYVPLRAPNGNRTALAEELGVELTPTLVVTYEGLHCEVDADGDEDCDYTEEPVETFIGANAIIEALDSTIDAYTYANPPE